MRYMSVANLANFPEQVFITLLRGNRKSARSDCEQINSTLDYFKMTGCGNGLVGRVSRGTVGKASSISIGTGRQIIV